MKKETIYALLAGCAFFCLIFLGTFWYFSRSERAVTAAGETASAPSPAEAIPAASPIPVVVPEKSVAPAGAPPATTEPRPPTSTAYGEAVGVGIVQGTSPYPPARNSQVAPPDQEEEEGTRHRDRLHGSATLRGERARRRTETPD